ncbi:hypothetical protein QL996_04985 [Planococcus sp. APC 4015]|nr:hypothetical protein [Planococcus sp. APC 4015]
MSAPGDEGEKPETQEERALRALAAIQRGADLTDETLALSNEFTDRHTARFTTWLRRLFGRE